MCLGTDHVHVRAPGVPCLACFPINQDGEMAGLQRLITHHNNSYSQGEGMKVF